MVVVSRERIYHMRLVDKLSLYMDEEKACCVLIFMVSPHTCLEGYMSATLS
jgi:hypothetical protein